MKPKSHPPPTLTRREALRGAAAAAAAFTIVPGHVLGGAGRTSPSEKPSIAGIGLGSVGFIHIQQCARAGFQVTALCDVDAAGAKRTFDLFPEARLYRDFRELLETEGDKIDAVYCGTPDHTHASVTLAALKRKKHVCCVKPLTRTLHESHVVVRAAREAQVATLMTAAPNTDELGCRTCELIWAGAIGAVREVHTWSDRPQWPQAMMRPPGEDPVPSTLDWKLWLGPAPMRPFKSTWPEEHLAVKQVPSDAPRRGVYHPWNFRGWWDFGTGALGDMGSHHFNTPIRALKLGYPVGVHASTTKLFEETAPRASIVTYDFPARADRPPVRVVWYDGGVKPPCPKEWEGPLAHEGTLYLGDEGKLLVRRPPYCKVDEVHVLPASRAEKFEKVPRTLPRSTSKWSDWFEACRGGEPAPCNFDVAGPMTDLLHLGNIAIRTGKPLEWDAKAARITNCEDAQKYVNPPYHNGWSLES